MQHTSPLRRTRLALLVAIAAAVGTVALAGAPAHAAPTKPTASNASTASAVKPAAVPFVQPTKTYTNALGTVYNNPGSEDWAGPAIGDVDGDGVPDVISGARDGYLRIWSSKYGLQKYYLGAGAINGTPSLADWNRDGVKDIAVASTSGDAYVINDVGGLHVLLHEKVSGGEVNGIFSAPVMADINGDGLLDLVATSWNDRVYVWQHSGALQPGFPFFDQDTSWSSPVIADLNHDGKPEIIFGYDCVGTAGDNCYRDYKRGGGYVGALQSNGTWLPGWPQFYPGQTIWSTPAVADLTGTGNLDVVVGTGLYWTANPNPGQQVLAFGPNGARLWTTNVAGRTISSPAIGDLNGDGKPDVAIVSETGLLYMLNGATGKPLVNPIYVSWTGGSTTSHASPVIADVTGDGKPDVVVGTSPEVEVVDAAHDTIVEKLRTPGGTSAVTAPPAVADIGGKNAVYAATTLNGNTDQVIQWALSTPYGNAPWPVFRQNSQGTGHVEDTTPPAVTLSVTPGSTTALPVTVTATDAGTGVLGFDVQTLTAGTSGFGVWAANAGRTSGTAASATWSNTLYTNPGRAYSIRVRARDAAGNVSAWVGANVSIPSDATYAQSVHAAYALGSTGAISVIGGVPLPSAGAAVRAIAASSNGGGYVALSDGRVSPIGGAPALKFSDTWGGRDYTKGIVLLPDQSGGYVLDYWGGLHPFGDAARVTTVPLPTNHARGVVLLPSSTATAPAGYVVDLSGGLHAFGGAPGVRVSATWPGQDVVRGIVINPQGTGGGVLDEYGQLHPYGTGLSFTSAPLWPGHDVARGAALSLDGTGAYVLDYLGLAHHVGNSPSLPVIGTANPAIGISIA